MQTASQREKRWQGLCLGLIPFGFSAWQQIEKTEREKGRERETETSHAASQSGGSFGNQRTKAENQSKDLLRLCLSQAKLWQGERSKQHRTGSSNLPHLFKQSLATDSKQWATGNSQREKSQERTQF